MLSPAESQLIDALAQKGLDRPSATVATVIVSRGIARPKEELVDILRQEPALENRGVTQNAVENLLGRGWLISEKSYDLLLVREAPDLKEKIAYQLGNAEALAPLSAASVSAARWLKILGPMTDGLIYQTYLDAIRTAQREIRLPMLATTPELSSVPLLKDRAQLGVKVRILLGSEDVVAKVRGESNRQTARDAIKGWSEHCRNSPNMQLRVFTRERDAMISTCTSIDGTVLRWDLYDVMKQRSLQGVMLEVKAPEGQNINLVQAFDERFDDAWEHSKPIDRKGALWWHLRRRWEFESAALAMILILPTSRIALAVALLIGVASGLAANGIIREAERHGRLRGWRDV